MTKDLRPPFAEDFLRWLNGFFAPTIYEATIVASYSFSVSKYESVLQLPWPFVPRFFHLPRKLRNRPIEIIGVTTREKLPGAVRATFTTDLYEGKRLWRMMTASYRERLLQLAPQKILPAFDMVVREYIIRR